MDRRWKKRTAPALFIHDPQSAIGFDQKAAKEAKYLDSISSTTERKERKRESFMEIHALTLEVSSFCVLLRLYSSALSGWRLGGGTPPSRPAARRDSHDFAALVQHVLLLIRVVEGDVGDEDSRLVVGDAPVASCAKEMVVFFESRNVVPNDKRF
ncbi:MAG: hypothetical protein NTW21_15140 [Verrucomicrobia bacterium]|nr:hypothetical protein [Verrucomicrobiota bacterium]